MDNPSVSEQSRKREDWCSSQGQRKGKGKENWHLETFTDTVKMSPGSVCLGPCSAYHCSLNGILVSSKQQPVREEAEPCSTGMMGTVSKETQESPTCTILYQPHMQHQGSPHLQETPAMFLVPWALGWELHWGLPSAAPLVVAAPMAEHLSCCHPPWSSQEGPHVTVTLQHLPQGLQTMWAHRNKTTAEAGAGLWQFCRHELVLSLSDPEAQAFPDACWDPCLLLQWHVESQAGKGRISWHLYTLRVTHIQVVPQPGGSGLPSRINISLLDGGGCVLSASWLNKPAEWAPSRKPISRGIHLLHVGQGELTLRSGAYVTSLVH